MPHELRTTLEEHGHEVFTVVWKGWGGIRNGRLMRLAADDGLEVIITLDKGIEHQQNLETLPLAVIIDVPNDDTEALTMLLHPLLETLQQIRPFARARSFTLGSSIYIAASYLSPWCRPRVRSSSASRAVGWPVIPTSLLMSLSTTSPVCWGR